MFFARGQCPVHLIIELWKDVLSSNTQYRVGITVIWYLLTEINVWSPFRSHFYAWRWLVSFFMSEIGHQTKICSIRAIIGWHLPIFSPISILWILSETSIRILYMSEIFGNDIEKIQNWDCDKSIWEQNIPIGVKFKSAYDDYYFINWQETNKR